MSQSRPSRPPPNGGRPPVPPRPPARVPPRTAAQRRPPPPGARTGAPTLIVLGGVVLLFALLAGVYLTQHGPAAPGGTSAVTPATAASTPAAMAAAATAVPQAAGGTAGPTAYVPAIAGLTVVSGLARDHITSPHTYAQVPPLGGPHYSEWQDCGIYTQPVQNENAVHSLEHGAIWITYRPGLPAAQLAILQTLTQQSGYRLLSPYPGLPHPIVASAWGYQLPLEQADDPRLMAFITAFEKNPNGPEPGASCSGGKKLP